MPKLHDPKFFLWPLFAILLWSAVSLHPASASAVSLRGSGFQIVETPLASARAQAQTPNWVLPSKSALTIVHEFLRPTSDWGSGHRGVDFETSEGDVLLTPHSGRISLAGLVFGVPTVVVEHSKGSSSVFQPVCLGSRMRVGDILQTGARFGSYCDAPSGQPHCGALPCVHWAFRLDRGVYLNPLRMVGLLRPSTLRPIGRVSELG